MRLAVVGGGVAGISAAWLLSRKHEVTLFEAGQTLGGHTHTVEVPSGPDQGTPVDMGFIVCNDRTYPNFHVLLKQLGCGVRDADMSFGYQDEESGLAYSGSGLNGLFAQRRNLFSPYFYSLLSGLLAFQREGRRAMGGGLGLEGSLGDFLESRGISKAGLDHYVLPMARAIWSAPSGRILEFPARSFLSFCSNHGLLSLTDMPQWQTVLGGSHAYVKAFRLRFKGHCEIGAVVMGLRRRAQGVEIGLKDGSAQSFEGCVVATHADQALALLRDPDADEQRLLGAWAYQRNLAVLHTDESLLPKNPRARASWNYHRVVDSRGEGQVALSYDMNRLQGLKTQSHYLVTLNLAQRIKREAVIKEIYFEHPVFSARAVASQAELPSLCGRRKTWFCGSYFGWGFHEDAVKSSVAVAEALGCGW